MDDVSLVTLRTRLREHADIVNETARYPDATIDRLLDEAGHFVYDAILARFEGYNRTTGQATNAATSGTVEFWTIPANFYKLYLVRFNFTGLWVRLRLLREEERVSLRNSVTAILPPKYDLFGNTLQLLPAPSFDAQVFLEYAPTFPHLAVGPPAVDFPGVNGWEDAVLAHAKVLVRRRDDMDTADAERDEARTMARITLMAGSRNESEPRRLRDVYSRSQDVEYAPSLIDLHYLT